MKKTKIVCTIGPACQDKTTLEKMVKAGMNVARLNFSHGTYTHHKLLIKNIREVSKKLKTPIPIIQDLQGPRMRVGLLQDKGIELQKNQVIILYPQNKVTKKLFNNSKETIIPVQYPGLISTVNKGNRILINDGLLELIVTSKNKTGVYARVVRGGLLMSHKGLNIPGVKIKMPVITQKDKEDLKFGLENNVDFIALSFVESAKNIEDLRKLILNYDPKSELKIIAKIERQLAIKNFSKILESVDAIMVARGDLGVELPPEEVPILQKEMVERCIRAAKPVIVATQMLDSMIRNPRPTRAEASDVANAVVDHTDAVMLSGETAFGQYPIETVGMMSRIIEQTEKSAYDDLPHGFLADHYRGLYYAMTNGAHEISKHLQAKVIATGTMTGKTALFLSRHRPDNAVIVALSPDPRVVRQLVLSWGVFPSLTKEVNNLSSLVKDTEKIIKQAKFAKKGDKIIMVTGHPVGKRAETNLIEVRQL